MWNDTDFPLGYLTTIRCYGTWLHGDKRGSVNRHRNKFGTLRLPEETSWLETNTERLRDAPVKLDQKQRACVESAIRETCKKRGWDLLAVNARTNHVHAVVSAGQKKSGLVLNALKANSTREMRESGLWLSERTPWADKGSERYLWNEKSIEIAINYVLYGQGDWPAELDSQ